MKPKIYRETDARDHRAELDKAVVACRAANVRLGQTQEALCREVNRLADELETQSRELSQRGQAASLNPVASRVTKDLRRHLNRLLAGLSQLRQRVAGDPLATKLVNAIDFDGQSLDAALDDLLSFTADISPQVDWIAVRPIVDEVCAMLTPQLAERDIETAIDVPRQLCLMADRELLRSALLNLALNAVDAMQQGGRLVVTSYIGPRGLELEVADSGPGLSEDTQRQIFEPFFTTKLGGTGLGLATVQRIARAHGGDVVAMNCPEGGAAFTLRFPRHSLEAAA